MAELFSVRQRGVDLTPFVILFVVYSCGSEVRVMLSLLDLEAGLVVPAWDRARLFTLTTVLWEQIA